MLEVRKDLKKSNKSIYKASFDQLIKDAEKIIKLKPVAITDKPDECTAITGDKRDFMSVGNYSWPNPDTPDGMPWIRKDGHMNPNAKRYDLIARLKVMCSRVEKLGLAYFFTGDIRYAEKATEYANIWFINPETRMNPHLKYAACLPGHNNGMGFFYGIIQGCSFMNCLAGLSLIKETKYYTPQLDEGIKQWVSEMYTWLTTSDMGIKESRMKNNHSTAYYMQLMAYAEFMGDDAAIKNITDTIRNVIIARQIEPDGRMPSELARPFAYTYTLLNIDHLLVMCEMQRDTDPNLFFYTTSDGRSISKSVDFALQYLGKSVEDFKPYRQTQQWDSHQIKAMWMARKASTFDPDGPYGQIFKKYLHLESPNNMRHLIY